MENYIFKKDYSDKGEIKNPVTKENLVVKFMIMEYLDTYCKCMDKLPKIVIQKDKQTFERLVPKLDDFAKRHCGSIEAVIDYEHWDSHINIILPFFEVCCPEDAELFIDIAQNSQTFCFQPADKGKVRLYILIRYFDDVLTNDWEELAAIAENMLEEMESDDIKEEDYE